MKKITTWIVGILCAASLLVTPAVLAADDVVSTPVAAEAWTVSLGGVGSSVTSGDTATVFGADLSVGRTGKLLLPLEGGLRQSISYDGDDTLLTTRVYLDWTLFTVKTVDVFAGGNVGLQYGNTTPSWEIAPEAGVRWWLKDDVAVLARAEYPFDMDGWEQKDVFRYFLGFQVKF
jgi:hypothetical protein